MSDSKHKKTYWEAVDLNEFIPKTKKAERELIEYMAKEIKKEIQNEQSSHT